MKSTERFSQTVQDYLKYRPSYPADIVQTLVKECGLSKESIIADIGSGTGLLSKLLLEHGNTVYGVEPNKPMRIAAEEHLSNFPLFHSINGTAEATTLKDQSVDFITAATAFHWFEAEKAKIEFKRILRQPGWVALIWNTRDIKNSPLLKDYEKLIIKFGKDYSESKAKQFDKTVNESFFSPHNMHLQSFDYLQQFDWEGFKGRLLSTSYALRPGEKGFKEMLIELRKIFDCYQHQGKVDFPYVTKLYYGKLNP